MAVMRMLIGLAFLVAACSCFGQNLPSKNRVPSVAPGEFPGVGRTYTLDFGAFKGDLQFLSERKARFYIGGKMVEEYNIHITRIRPHVFMVAWQEKAGGSVVHIEDFANKIVYSNVSKFPGTNKLAQLKGTMREKRRG
jgi:hypothetical protein